jgi:L-histidine N-alpha-methyltransferase
MTAPAVEVVASAEERELAMRDDVRAGLAARPRSVPPVWFYDEAGSRLFDEITRLPEYYLTRAERAILAERSAEIAALSGASTLIEIGSGTSEKTRLLLDAMASSGRLRSVVLLDISEEVLREAAATLAGRYRVDVQAVVGDLRTDLPALSRRGEGERLWAFLGSTIGNFEPKARSDLFAGFRRAMRSGDALLLGADLVKDVDRLLAAYDDSRGVTAEFNLNVLRVLNSVLGADFRPERFAHRASWNGEERWVEMRLRSTEEQKVRIGSLGLDVDFADGEEILTEISAKFEPAALAAELADAGFAPVGSWTDPDGDFLLTLSRPA